MSRGLHQEFFWTPAEFAAWLQRMSTRFDFWICRWRPGHEAVLIKREDLSCLMIEGGSQLFVGANDLTKGPKFQRGGTATTIAFTDSYAVQLVPPTLVGDGRTLLQGHMAIMSADAYGDEARYLRLRGFFNQMRRELRRASDSDYKISQRLAGGADKLWRDILVSPDAARSGAFVLKQFPDGAVRFEAVKAQGDKLGGPAR
jgi:hypothetical protein